MVLDISDNKIKNKQLANKLLNIRLSILEHCAIRGGHLASSFSCVEIMGVLFEKHFTISQPYQNLLNRDNFILSKGHAENSYYAFLVDMGFLTKENIFKNYRAGNFEIGGHPSNKTPGIDASTGALGHGIGLGCGMAFAKKKFNIHKKVLVLMGDSECTEGSVWESAIFASTHKLNNLCIMIDNNGLGATDFTNKFTDIDNLHYKFQAFGFDVTVCENGNHINEVSKSFEKALIENQSPKPKAIIFQTKKAFGAGRIANTQMCHSLRVTEAIYKEISIELYKNYLESVTE